VSNAGADQTHIHPIIFTHKLKLVRILSIIYCNINGSDSIQYKLLIAGIGYSVSRCRKGREESGIPGGYSSPAKNSKGGGARPVLAARQERGAREPRTERRTGERKDGYRRTKGSDALEPSGWMPVPGYGFVYVHVYSFVHVMGEYHRTYFNSISIHLRSRLDAHAFILIHVC
jgi:hypothetical protein